MHQMTFFEVSSVLKAGIVFSKNKAIAKDDLVFFESDAGFITIRPSIDTLVLHCIVDPCCFVAVTIFKMYSAVAMELAIFKSANVKLPLKLIICSKYKLSFPVELVVLKESIEAFPVSSCQ